MELICMGQHQTGQFEWLMQWFWWWFIPMVCSIFLFTFCSLIFQSVFAVDGINFSLYERIPYFLSSSFRFFNALGFKLLVQFQVFVCRYSFLKLNFLLSGAGSAEIFFYLFPNSELKNTKSRTSGTKAKFKPYVGLKLIWLFSFHSF